MLLVKKLGSLSFFQIIFIFFFFLILAFEGLGLYTGREISLYLILFLPLLLFFYDYANKTKIHYPRTITYSYCLFLLFSFASFILAVNHQTALEYLLFYSALYLIFLSVYNHKKDTEKIFVLLIFLFSLLYAGYALILNIFQINLLNLIPDNGYQFVFSRFSSHNHLGDFLLIPLVYSLYQIFTVKKTKYLLWFLIFVPFLIISFSRSAYLSLTITTGFLFANRYRKRKISLSSKHAWITFLTIFIFGLLFFGVVVEANYFPLLSSVNQFLQDNLDLKQKILWGGRPYIIKEALMSFWSNPFFGVGPGNFIYASIKYTDVVNYWAETAHNLPLDILAENGLMAFLFFIGFLAALYKRAEKNYLFFLFLALLINFQFDYSYRIYSLFLIFFIISALMIKDERKLLKFPPLVMALVIFILTLDILSSNFFLQQKNYRLSLSINPANNKAFMSLVQAPTLPKKGKLQLINTYANLYSREPSSLSFIADQYYSFGNQKEALRYYLKAHQEDPYSDFERMAKIYNLTKSLYGDNKAHRFILNYFDNLGEKNISFAPDSMITEIYLFCEANRGIKCPKNLWRKQF